jgi:hypothetical protein
MFRKLRKILGSGKSSRREPFQFQFERLEERAMLDGFGFADFSGDVSSLNLVGDAAITADARLELNPAAGNQAGAAWYSAEKQYVAEGFSTTFQFQMTSPNDSEGLTFAIQNTDPSFLGAAGPMLAYNGLNNSLVVEFDTFHNGGDLGDPSASHISVHTRGTDPNSANEVFSLGSFSTNPLMDDGAVHTAKITYTPGTLSVYLDNMSTPVLTVAVDLTSTLALDNGSAWVGFTASTGGGTQIHDILNWQVETPTPPATPVSISDLSQAEGDSGTASFSFTVTRSGDTSGMTTVDWTVADGTATAGSDYVASSGQVVFAAGETSIPVAIAVNSDATVEPHETFSVQLSNATGGTIVDAMGVGTILNDETTIAIADASVTEGERGYAFLDTFVTESDGGYFHGRGVAFGPDGNLYLGHLGGPGALRFNGETGAFMNAIVDVTGPSGSAQVLFHDGNLFVVEERNVVTRFDGQALAPLPAPGKTGAMFVTLGDQVPSTQRVAAAIAFGPDGNLYISIDMGNSILTDSILKYDGSTGEYLGVFVSAGSGGLSAPVGLTFGPDGHLYVGTTNHSGPDAVLRFQGPLESNPGAFIDTFVASGSGGLDRVPSGGIWFRPDGDLYVTSGDTSSVLRFNGTTGAFVETVVASGEGGLSAGGGITWDDDGLLYVASQNTHEVLRYAPATSSALRVSLAQPSAVPVTVSYSTANGTALAGSDYVASSGTITFAPGETTRAILVPTLDDSLYEGNESFVVNLSNPSAGATIADAQGTATIVENDIPPTKFFVVNDGSPDRTYEYAAGGAAIENYALNAGNTAPRGAASTTVGDKVWVVDNNRNVYVYNTSGALLGSWTAGTMNASAQPQGIATDGTDVWIVDAKTDKVYKYAGAASRLSGSQNAASSFSLNTANKDASDIVTDGTSLWVTNDAATNKVFKYTTAGALLGSWTIDAANATPTGITIDPASPSTIWIVDSGSDKIYEYTVAASRTSGSQSASAVYSLAAGNTNPQGIADPPAGWSSGFSLSEPANSQPKGWTPTDQPPGIAKALEHLPVAATATGLREHAAALDFFFAHVGKALEDKEQGQANNTHFGPPEPGDQPPGVAKALEHLSADAPAHGLREHAAALDFFFSHVGNSGKEESSELDNEDLAADLTGVLTVEE